MTELKYLEEVLPAYRAGKTIGRNEFNRVFYYNINAKATDRPVTYTLNELCSPTAISEKVWFIKLDLVSWPKAWEALKAGKRIKDVSTGAIYQYNTLFGDPIMTQISPAKDRRLEEDKSVPLSWLDREDFEVLDEMRKP